MANINKNTTDSYGIIPKSVMRDKNLSIRAKALYAYISSYIGNNEGVSLDIDLACKEMGITKIEFQEYEKELLNKKLIGQ